MSITTPVSLLANEFDVRSVLHGQVRLAPVIQIHKAMNRLQKSKDLLKDRFQIGNVNIQTKYVE